MSETAVSRSITQLRKFRLWKPLVLIGAFWGCVQGSQVNANFSSESSVAVTANGYIATGNDVSFTLNFMPRTGAQLKVVENTSHNPITGAFSNLTQGQGVTLQYGVAKLRYVANYYGGNGNDLVLQWADAQAYGSGGNVNGELGDYRLSLENDLVPVATDGVLAGKTIVAVSSGTSHSVALCVDGTLASWGANGGVGALGNNKGPDSRTPILVDRSGYLAGRTVTRIAAGFTHTLALCSDGTVATWGHNTFDFPQGNDDSPVPVAVSTAGILAGKRVISIAAGMSHNLALCSDGTLVSWGYNANGQLGTTQTIDFTFEPVAVDRSGVLAGKTVIAIACGGRHSLALCSDGTLAAWGANTYGELGTGSTVDSNVPVAVVRTGALSGKQVVAIAAGGDYSGNHSMALCSDGTVTTWGANTAGQLGNGGTTSKNVPVKVSTTGVLSGKSVVAIAAGLERGYALCSDGTAVGWGSRASGISGDHTGASSNLPVAISTSLAGTGVKIAGLCNSPTAYRGFLLLARPMTETRLSKLHVDWGESDAASPITGSSYAVAVPHGTSSIRVTPTSLDADATVKVNGTLVPRGGSSVSLPLAGTTTSIQISVTAPDGTSTKTWTLTVFRGNDVSAGFSSTRDVALTCPAFDANGLSLNLSIDFPLAPGVELKVIDNQGIDFIRGSFSNLPQGQVVSLSYGSATYRLAVDYHGGDGNDLVLRWANRKPYFWGSGVPQQPGAGGTNSTVPVTFIQSGALNGRIIEKMDSGDSHGLAVCTDGSVIGWGRDLGGSLGGHDLALPTVLDLGAALVGKRVIKVAVGNWESLVLCSDGTVFAWGNNYFGQLGNYGEAEGSSPVQVNQYGALIGRKVVAVSVYSGTTLALCSDGTLVAWGFGFGPIPSVVGKGGSLEGKVVRSISQGKYHAMALCTDGKLVSWGYNTGGSEYLTNSPTEIFGQLGQGADYSSSYPVAVKSDGVLVGKTIVEIAAGGTHSMARCSDGTVTTWGENRLGQLGDDTTVNRLAPVMVYSQEVLQAKVVAGIAGGATNGMALCSDGSIATWGGNSMQSHPAALGLPALPMGAKMSALVPGPEGDHSAIMASTPFDDSRMVGLVLSSGNLIAPFSPGQTEYLVSVSQSMESIRVTPTLSDIDAKVIVNGVPVSSGTPSQPLPVAPGQTVIKLIVTSPDNSTSTTYNFSIIRPVSFNATYLSPTDIPAEYPVFDASGMSPSIVLGFAPSAPQDLMLVKITMPAFAAGRFGNLQQGQLVNLTYEGASYPYVVDYYGGDGNDIVLRWADTKAYAWGNNAGGQLGSNGASTRNIPTAVGGNVLAGKTIKSISSIGDRCMALCSDGTLAKWGGLEGTLPVQVSPQGALAGKTVVGITCRSLQPLALCSDGTIATWNNGSSAPPVAMIPSGALVGKAVVKIAAGANHVIALCSDGSLVAWGSNSFGQLGSGGGSPTAPVLVSTAGVLAGKTVISISAGSDHSLALCSDGTLAAWGQNSSSQLGDNSTTSRFFPVAVDRSGILSDKTVVAISAGYRHNLALCSDGTLAAWGSGTNGVLGNGSNAKSGEPVLVNRTGVLAGKTVVSVAAYQASSDALCSDGSLATWGSNFYGELGSGSTASNSSVPVAVSMQPLGGGERFLFLGSGQDCTHVLAAATSSLSNTKLSGLTLGGITLSPTFSPTITTYTGTLAASSQSVTVRPTPAGSWVSVAVNGTRVATGATSEPIPLALGLNTFTVSVTAQDRSVGTYSVSVNNAPYETWKKLSFPNVADRTNPEVSGWSASPAGDGISNLMKYGLGLNPFSQSQSLMPTVRGEDGCLAFTYRRNKLAGDLSFVVEACDDPASQTWTELQIAPVVEDKGDYWLVKVRDSELMSNHPKRFMRLRIGTP